MYGYNVGTLNVYTRTFIGGPLTKIWSQNGEKGDEWLRAKVTLSVAQPFQILIEGVRGVIYRGISLHIFFFCLLNRFHS